MAGQGLHIVQSVVNHMGMLSISGQEVAKLAKDVRVLPLDSLFVNCYRKVI
jgi:hypothetical protein